MALVLPKLVHEFGPEGAPVRTLPVTDRADRTNERKLSGFRGRGEAPGGYISAVGEISQAEFEAFPAAYALGVEWRVYIEGDANPIWSGWLKKPRPEGGTVLLSGVGMGAKLDRERKRRLWLDRGTDDWTPGDADPFELDVDPQISAEVDGRVLKWSVARNETFKRGPGGSPSHWTTPLVRWEPENPINNLSGTIKLSHPTGEYVLEILAGTGPNGALTSISEISLSGGSTIALDQAIPGSHDMIVVRLKRSSQVKKARRFTARLIQPTIRSKATSNNYKPHQVALDLAPAGWDTTQVDTTSTQNVMPLDGRGMSDGEILDQVAGILGWRHLGEHKRLRFGPYTQRVWQHIARYPASLIPQDPYNEVLITYRYAGGVVSRKRIRANPDPSPGFVNTFPIELDDPPPEDIATAFGQAMANYLSQERFYGEAEIAAAIDAAAPGVEVDGRKVEAGDSYQVAGVELIIGSVEKEDGKSRIEFPEGHPFLERLLASRKRALAMGRSQAQATLGGLNLDRPATPGSIVLGVKEIERRGPRDWDAVLDWAEVTTDLSGNPTAIQAYEIEWRYTDASGVVIAESAGGGTHKTRVEAQEEDGDPNDPVPTRGFFRKLNHPHKWHIQARMRSRDVLGKRSPWSDWTPHIKPSAFTAPAPTGVIVDVDQHWLRARWDNPDETEVETDLAPQIDRRIKYWKYRILKNGVQWFPSSGWRRIFDPELSRKIAQPRSHTWALEVKAVDYYGNESTVASASNVKGDPPTPSAAPTITFSRGGKKGVRATVAFTYAGAGSWGDADISKFAVQLQAEDSTPTGSDKVRWGTLEVSHADAGSAQEIAFEKIKAGELVRARYRAIDDDDRKSDWSAWSIVYTAAASKGPGPVQNLDREAEEDGAFRTITWSWQPPVAWSDGTTAGWSEDQVAGYDLTPRKNGVEQPSMKVTMHKSTQYSRKFQIGSGTWTLKVEPRGWDEIVGLSAVAPTGVSPRGVGGSEIDAGAIGYTHIAPALGAIVSGNYGSPATTGSPPRSYLPSGPGGYKQGDLLLNTGESPPRLYKLEGSTWYRATDGSDLTTGSLVADKIATGTLQATVTVSGQIRTAAVGSPRVEISSDDFQGHLRFYDASAKRGHIYQNSSGLSLTGNPSSGGSAQIQIGDATVGVKGLWSDWAIFAEGPIYEYGGLLSGRYAGISHGHGSHSHGIPSDGGHTHTYDKVPANHGHGGSTGTASGHSHSIPNVSDVSTATSSAGGHNHGGTNNTTVA